MLAFFQKCGFPGDGYRLFGIGEEMFDIYRCGYLRVFSFYLKRKITGE